MPAARRLAGKQVAADRADRDGLNGAAGRRALASAAPFAGPATTCYSTARMSALVAECDADVRFCSTRAWVKPRGGEADGRYWAICSDHRRRHRRPGGSLWLAPSRDRRRCLRAGDADHRGWRRRVDLAERGPTPAEVWPGASDRTDRRSLDGRRVLSI